jgi:hypothetical protein
MRYRRPAGLAAGLLMLVLAAPVAVAAPGNVTVRVEGQTGTLVEETALRTTTAPVNKSGQAGEDCTGTSAAGALELATAGDWAGTYNDAFGYSVDRIRTEEYQFGNPDSAFWSFWVNDELSQQGVCGFELQEGDDVLFLVDRCVNPQPPDFLCQNDPVQPLELRAPAAVRTGETAEVTVVRYASNGTPSPEAGARVTGPGVDVTTGAGGRAAIAFAQPGQYRLKAAKDGAARSAAEVVTVSDTAAPPPPGGAGGPAADETAPAGRIRGIRNGQRFSRRRAPRTLRGSVTPDPSGLRAVKLSLTRSHRGRCSLYSPSRERFRPSRCGRRVNFRIGDRQDWSYLLPRKLGRGRYVLDVIAVDKAGNRDQLARGRSRVVFFVR